MNKLPKLPRTKTPQAQKCRLARWMDEWDVYQQLRETDVVPGPMTNATGAEQPKTQRMPAQCDRPSGDPPAVGQIWLIHPTVSGDAMGPVYVAIMAMTGNGLLRVVPYGRFAEPALPDELRTKRPEPFLHVLQIGQTADLPVERVACGWLITHLAPADFQDAKEALADTRAGRKITGRLALRIAPPLWSVLDPRHEYLEEELDRLRFLHGEQINWLVRDETSPTWGRFVIDGEAIGLAAEARNKFNDEC